MTFYLRRRDFIAGLGSAVAWPIAGRAQQRAMPVIGFLGLGSPDPNSPSAASFRQGLAEAGYVPGKNVRFESRYANFQPSLLPQLAASLVEHRVAVITTGGSPYAAVAAKAATSTIPIVFVVAEDPMKYGLVASFNRPGGNATGVTFRSTELPGKRLSLLLELSPHATRVGYLSGSSDSPVFEDYLNEMVAAGHALGQEIILGEVRNFDFEAAFATLVEQRATALVVGDYTFFRDSRNLDKILELAIRYRIPAIYPDRQYGVNGGLLSYGASNAELSRQAGIYTGRIIKGEKPTNLPVMQPTKFELVLNLKAAKMLGVTVPPLLRALADEVIE